MRRFAYAMPLLAVPLAAAACGGSKSSSSTSTAALSDDPVAAVNGAAAKTAQAGSEHLTIAGRVFAGGQTVTFTGSGDFDTKKHVGSLKADFSAGGLNGSLEEVSSGTDAYVKSDLLSALIPGGKQWVKLNLAKTAQAQGVSLTSFLSQDPSQALTKLQGLRAVRKVGEAADATHYRSTFAVAKPKGATKAGAGRYDVWIGKDGYVHTLKATVKSGGTTSTLTTNLSAFGEAVSVTVPKAADTYDGTKGSIPGLGG
ncbi:MAG: hypothetical protein QOI27_1994 [Gaiellaceae bacterium]|jgi:hypothetical protein|nr:hypothetical protein [Gaiellaceae bacterium]